jgi:D-proline reductase (dithiol) PrdB
LTETCRAINSKIQSLKSTVRCDKVTSIFKLKFKIDFKRENSNLKHSGMELIENLNAWSSKYARWRGGDDLKDYTFVSNKRSPFTAIRRALPLINIALISSAGAFIDGTNPFDANARGGDFTFREIPIEVEAEDLQFTSRGYDPAAVRSDLNSQIPIQRLLDYQASAVIGQLNPVWWSFSGFAPDAAKVADTLAPQLAERLHRYEVQAALIIPASRLCHQSCGIVARAIEASGVSTMMLAVERQIVDMVHPPRVGYYGGEFGSVAGLPNHKLHQLRILDESIRSIESLDQPTVRRLIVELESEVEEMRGEK